MRTVNAIDSEQAGLQRLLRAGRHASLLLSGAALLALAACSESEDAPAIVGGAQAQTEGAGAPTDAAQAPATEAAERRTDPSAATVPTAQGSVDEAALLEPGPLPDVVIGNADAPVTIIEYASMTCPHCASFHSQAWPDVKADYVDTGVARLILREAPFDPRSLAAFMLARCVPENQRTPMIDVLFQQQSQWAQAENASVALLSIARLSGMSQGQFTACLQNSELQGQIVQSIERAQSEFDVRSTPTFFVNGQRYVGAMSADQMAAVIEAAR